MESLPCLARIQRNFLTHAPSPPPAPPPQTAHLELSLGLPPTPLWAHAAPEPQFTSVKWAQRSEGAEATRRQRAQSRCSAHGRVSSLGLAHQPPESCQHRKNPRCWERLSSRLENRWRASGPLRNGGICQLRSSIGLSISVLRGTGRWPAAEEGDERAGRLLDGAGEGAVCSFVSPSAGAAGQGVGSVLDAGQHCLSQPQARGSQDRLGCLGAHRGKHLSRGWLPG